ncbi:hypothetical protein ACPV3U_12400 [Vibrio rotiferianus]|jgi:hypothetical protein|uniref:hypothetical protein n=1 Tax=Vibrio rotiferianus TaxID=190895 RepID=UPI00406A3391
MAAQKLTKARLAQILIMLSVLITAFVWRTFNYESMRSVDCSQKERCDVTIGRENIQIRVLSDKISIQTAKNSRVKIDLNQSGNYVSINDGEMDIPVNELPANRIIFLQQNSEIVSVTL